MLLMAKMFNGLKMKPDKIKALIQDKTKVLTELADKISKEFDEEVIHNFRITYKSLRALLKLLQENNSDEKVAMPAKIKKLYNITGMLRDIQLERRELAMHKLVLPGYYDQLSYTIIRQKKNWQKQYRDGAFRRFEKRLASAEYNKLSVVQLRRFIKARIKEIKRIVKEGETPDNVVHCIRKKIKTILSLAELTNNNWKSGKKHFKKYPVKEFALLAEEIGTFHDNRQRMAHFLTYAKSEIDGGEKQKMLAFYNEEMPHLNRQKVKILNNVKNICNGE